MRTLDVTGLSDEDLGCLCTLEQLNWSVLNESVGRCLIGLGSTLLRARLQKKELENQVNKRHRQIRNLDSLFTSAYRKNEEDIAHMRNNWVCYDFKARRVMPTHYAIRTGRDRGGPHLKSWLIETSKDGKSWREVAREEDNEQLHGSRFTGTFTVAGGEECRFIRLVNIGRNHYGDDSLRIAAWEIFGSLIE
jgi:hypothetical protein